MAEPNTDSDSLPPPPSAADGGGAVTTGGGFGSFFQLNRPKLRVTSEYDSESLGIFNKVSCKLFDNLAKLKLTFRNDDKGGVSEPQVYLTSKLLSLQYDVAESDALIKASFEIIPGLQLRAAHEVKARQGEVAMVADLAGPAYKLELSSALPFIGAPRATLKFPLGEVSFEERAEDEEEQGTALSVNAIVKRQFLDGLCTARYRDDSLNLRYVYKDEQMTFIPSICLPSNEVLCAFKRRFTPTDKLSYSYNFDTNDWSAVYKHTMGKDYKLKAGYDTKVRLGWASLWVGEEDGKAKTAPMKMKVQVMVQVHQDHIKSPALMFHVKKRWDI
ncbi:hypothetical protein MIMGU_mgv1a009845mg [Erythranthe guttata]|uniref:Outer envelope pore protein 37, chloroplastic n=2 Tax=Erythranthe guttata TaxID=4155 RepID=A0A022RA86_ERYGU|nr:hypothetical protein MIMGU_mgv1a009845mg [Erythranthe guttata]